MSRRYLYVFEDGSVKQSHQAPDADYLKNIEDGVINVYFFDGSEYQELDGEGEMSEVNIL